MMNPDEMASALRMPIADALKEAGHENLGEIAEEIARWVALVGPHVQRMSIAGEELAAYQGVRFGADGLVYGVTPTRHKDDFVLTDTCQGEETWVSRIWDGRNTWTDPSSVADQLANLRRAVEMTHANSVGQPITPEPPDPPPSP